MSSRPENNLRREGDSIIRCECGFEILLVPNLKMMAKAIEAHAAQHGEKVKDHSKGALEQQRIEFDLTAKTLKATGDFTKNKPL